MQMETRVPPVKFVFREDGEFVTRKAVDLFQGKRVLVFSLPGAFTPTCSNFQLPEYDLRYDEFIAAGIDEVYCIS
jgi:peroxiredoxin